MKKLFPFLALLIVAGVAAACFVRCSDDKQFTKEEVESKVETSPDGASNFISEANFLELSEKYAADKNSDGDTAGFYAALVGMLEDYGTMPTINQPQKAADKPLAVAIYLDNTSSMKGYINASSPGGNAVANVINALNAKYNDYPIEAYYINKDGLLDAARPMDLTADLMNNKVPFTDAYTMYAFIDTIATRALADSEHSRVNFFVTDAIPSFPSPDVIKNREINKEQAADLESRIAEATRKLAGKGYGVSFYVFNGNFNGEYINYRNNDGKKNQKENQLENVSRPFYVIAIGPAAPLQELADKADKAEVASFMPLKSLHALTEYKQPAVFVPKAKDDDGKYEVEEGESPINININVTSVPQYVLNAADFESAATAPLPIVITINGTDRTNELRSNGALSLKDGTLTITQQKVVDGDETIKVRFKNQINPSFLALSTDDDKDIKSQPGKTFNLDRVANGLVKGIYNNSSEVYLGPEFEIHIEED